jgi:hypothetical protein
MHFYTKIMILKSSYLLITEYSSKINLKINQKLMISDICSYGKFGVYNIVGAVLWTVLCTGAGYVFGNVPAVHDNFSLVVLGIVAVSLLPVVFEVLAARNEKKLNKN